MILCVIFVVLMLFWLFCGTAPVWGGPNPPTWAPLGNSIIPWLCVAILGWVVFGGGYLPSPPHYH